MTEITIDAASVDEAVIIMTRMFDAPREKVWECFTRPEHVVKWYGGRGFGNEVLEMDVRPGGLWRHVMHTPNGGEFRMDFVYVEVVKPSRLVWQHVDHGKRVGPPPTCRQAITLEDHGDRTRWTLVSTFSSMADRDFASKMGFAETITQGSDKFNDLVKTL